MSLKIDTGDLSWLFAEFLMELDKEEKKEAMRIFQQFIQWAEKRNEIQLKIISEEQ